MTLVVQLSDPHLRLDADRDAARTALDTAVTALLALPQRPDAVVITGDLADAGHPDEYAQVRDALRDVAAPVHVIPGNHDHRPNLERAFAMTETARAGGLRLVLCDTQVPGEPGGKLDGDRLHALLAQDRDTPTIVFMHHPPLFTGIPMLDEIGLAAGDADRLVSILQEHTQVQRVACGHVHRASFQTFAGAGVMTAPSTFTQAEPIAEPPGVRFVRHAAGIVLHHLRGREVISHVQPV